TKTGVTTVTPVKPSTIRPGAEPAGRCSYAAVAGAAFFRSSRRRPRAGRPTRASITPAGAGTDWLRTTELTVPPSVELIAIPSAVGSALAMTRMVCSTPKGPGRSLIVTGGEFTLVPLGVLFDDPVVAAPRLLSEPGRVPVFNWVTTWVVF